MKKLLVVIVAVGLALTAMPLLVAVVVVTSSQATAACNSDPGGTPGMGRVPVGAQAGPQTSTQPTTQAGAEAGTDVSTEDGVFAALLRVRLSVNGPTLNAEQAHDALVIAQVAGQLQVPRYGLQIALATALQESRLLNLDHGDRDSLGLFQQRPSSGWGSPAQVSDPILATEAFFGRADHTSNRGLLDISGWQQMSLTAAAQAVQGSGHPEAYAPWAAVAAQIATLAGGDSSGTLSGGTTDVAGSDCRLTSAAAAGTSLTVATLNLLGAAHTDGRPGGGHDSGGFSSWAARLPGAMTALDQSGASVAALQEAHPPQARALAADYSQRWAMYPASGTTQNKILWDPTAWTAVDQRVVEVPYFGGHPTGMPLMHLTSTHTGESLWVLGLHNPADTRGSAGAYRREALRRELTAATNAAAAGDAVVVLGDFNDAHDGTDNSQCVLTPALTNAFSRGPSDGPGGSTGRSGPDAPDTGGPPGTCANPSHDAAVDHIYGTHLTWAAAWVDHATETLKSSDHPLVAATATLGSPDDCALTALTSSPKVAAATDTPAGRPTPVEDATSTHGDPVAAPTTPGATSELDLPVTPRGATVTHTADNSHTTVGVRSACPDVVYPVPDVYIANDAHNWGEHGEAWDAWHTGTDFGAPCGTPVYAAHAGVVEIDTSQAWAGPYLVKVVTGADSLATWYAHMQQLTVSRGQSVQPGQQIGMVGEQGNAHGCHLHFEVHLHNGTIYGPDNVDPSAWLLDHAHSPAV